MISQKDNSINYSAGPVDFRVNLEQHVIEVSCSSYYNNMWEHCFTTLEEAWTVDRSKFIKINEYLYYIPYDLKILENYLDNSIYFGLELK